MAQPIPAMMNCPLSKAQPIPDEMMCPASKSPVVVIGSQFVAHHPIVLNIKKERLLPTEEFIVNDVKGSVLFSLKKDRVLLDASGKPLVTLQHQKLGGHLGWQVFRGDSTDLKHLLFSVRRSSLVQPKIELDVFLANINKKEALPDFKVKGSWHEGTITRVDLNGIIAMILDPKKQKPVGCPVTDGGCVVIVSPNVDYAFIATLVLILELSGAHNEDRNGGD